MCANGVCMLPDWKCNGIDECGDMSDEKNCTQPSPSKPGHGGRWEESGAAGQGKDEGDRLEGGLSYTGAGKG